MIRKILFCVAVLSSIAFVKNASAQVPAFPYNESFTKPAANTGDLVLGESAVLTGDGTVHSGITDAINNGFLRLTTSYSSFQKGFARSLTYFPSSNGIDVSFEYYIFNPTDGSSADGISFFLFDPTGITADPSTFQIGGFGGSLGYSQFDDNGVGTNDLPGLKQGYLGIGIDEFGNFSNSSEGRYGGNGGRRSNSISMRGAGNGFQPTQDDNPPPIPGTEVSNYPWLTKVTTQDSGRPGNMGYELDPTNGGLGIEGGAYAGFNFPLDGQVNGRTAGSGPGGRMNLNDSGYRKVRFILEPRPGGGFFITIWLTVGGVTPPNVAPGEGMPANTFRIFNKYPYTTTAPTTLGFGFGAATGTSLNFHEIRNIEAVVPASVAMPPVLDNFTRNGLEDQTLNFYDSEYFQSYFITHFQDPNGVNTLQNIKIVTLPSPSAGVLMNDVTPIVAGDIIAKADLGNITFIPVANWNGPVTFQWDGQDASGDWASATVTAGGGNKTVTINILPVNDLPLTANKTINGAINTGHVFTVADFTFTDPTDAASPSLADDFKAVKIITIPAPGSLELDGVAVSANDLIPVADIIAGKLIFVPVAAGVGTPYADFQFQVQDDGGTSVTLDGVVTAAGVDLSATKIMTLNITGANVPPVGASKTISVAEDGTKIIVASDFSFDDSADGLPSAFLSVTVTNIAGITGTLFLDLDDDGNVDVGEPVTLNQVITKANLDLNRLKFRPAANGNGTNYANFQFKVKDSAGTGSGGSDESVSAYTMTIDVTPINDAPTSAAETVTVLEDITTVIPTSKFTFADATDNPNANSLANVRITSLPAAGTLFVDLNDNGNPDGGGEAISLNTIVSKTNLDLGRLKFRPVANAHGNNYGNFNFTVIDNGGTATTPVGVDESIPYLMTVNVTSVNDAPTSAAETVTAVEDIAVIIPTSKFTFNDPNDSPANAFEFVKITTLPAGGTLFIDANNNGDVDPSEAVILSQNISKIDLDGNKLKYKSALHGNGAGYGNFNFSVIDDGGDANTGVNTSIAYLMTVNVTPVNDLPVAVADNYTTTKGGTLTVTAPGVLGNDSDVETVSLTAILVTNVTNGTLSLNANGSFTYTHNNGVSTSDSFTYKVNDGTADGNTVTVTIIINAPPTIQDIPKGSSVKNTPVAFTATDFTSKFSDTDGSDQLVKIRIVTLPPAGNGKLQLDGVDITLNQEIVAADLAKITFVPANNYIGAVSFQWNASDGKDYAAVAKSVTITIINTPPVISDVPKPNGVKNTPLPFTATDFTSKFTDDNSDPLVKIRIISLPPSGEGTLRLDGVAISLNQEIPAADIPKLTFTPANNYVGPSSFEWNGSDGTDYAATKKKVNITIGSGNALPVANPDSYTGTKGGVLNVPAATGVLLNDTDTDAGTVLKAIKMSDPQNGTLTLNDNGSFTYTHNGGTSTSDTFTYKVNDGTADGNTTTVTISTTGANVPPVVSNFLRRGTGFAPVVFTIANFTDNYFDQEQSPLTKVKITSLPSTGVLKFNGAVVIPNQEIPTAQLGGLSYEPPVNWNGTATFGWNGNDGVAYAISNAVASIEITLSGDPTAKIGLAKNLASAKPALNGTYDVKFVFTAVNYGLNALDRISIKDNLAQAFGGAQVSIISLNSFGNLKANPSYNGSSDTEMLLPASKLVAGEEARVELVVNVKLLLTGGLFQNTATGEGYSSVNGFKVTDVSTNGLKPDPLVSNDVTPSDATPIQLDPQPIYSPQGFSPNGDGINDAFVIQNAAGKLVSLEVYNRWGNRVYKSADYKNDWTGEVTEGFFLGRNIPDGTYYYVIVIENKDKYVGFITINR